MVVVTSRGDVGDESSIGSAARLLRLSDFDIKRLFDPSEETPVARLASVEEADRFRQELQAVQLESMVVPESALRLRDEGKRIHALILNDDSLTGLGTGKNGDVTALYKDIRLLVQGRLFSRRVETHENKRGRRTKLIDTREFSSDDSILDIYTRTDELNWRIVGNNFDFSCLGAMKRATAFENFALLIELLRERVTAPFDSEYLQSRQILNVVWPLEQRIGKDHGRSYARKSNVATITTTDNEGQFMRYSRLRHYLIGYELPGT